MDDVESNNLANASLDYGKSRRAPRRKNEGHLRASCPPATTQQQRQQNKRESNAAYCPGLADFMQGMQLEDEFGNPVDVIGGGANMYRPRTSRSTEDDPMRHSMPAFLEEDEEEELLEEQYNEHRRSSTESGNSRHSNSSKSHHRRRTTDSGGSGIGGGSPRSPRRKQQSDRHGNGGNLRHSMPVNKGTYNSPTSPVTPGGGGKKKVNLDKYDVKPLPFSRDGTKSRKQGPGGNLRHSMPVSQHEMDDSNNYLKRFSMGSMDSSDRSANNSPQHATRSSRKDPVSLSLSSCKKYLRHYVESLRLPPGCLPSVMKCYQSIDSRKWLIENSSSMRTRDAHCVKIDSNLGHVGSEDDVTRWDEFAQCFDFHLKMSARCWIPTQFWLVNDPGPDVGPQRFSVACGNKEDLSEEREIANEIIASVRLKQSRNPLPSQMRRIEKRIAKMAPRLIAENKHVTVVLCTCGEPSDEMGNKGAAVMQEFVDCLVSLTKLPVKVIIRLCTDNEKATEFFNRLDAKLDNIQVLDDYWGEAMEVYLHNPWLTYAFGLHRLREAGLSSDLIETLDERCFDIEDIYKFCKEFILGEDVDLPHPRNWDAFITSLESALRKEKQQWNPIKKKQTPWINIKKLEAMFGKSRGQATPSSSYSGAGVGQKEDLGVRSSPPKAAPPANNNNNLTLEQVIKRWSHQPPNFKILNPMQDLLVNMPTLFPPTNTKVEPHEYYDKWACISREAFTGEDDEVKAVLKRALRRSKLFLHPDKLPQDFTENQSFLFRTIWDVVQEQEQKTLK